MKGKTKGRCGHCWLVFRWLRSFGRVSEVRCPHCNRPLEATPWGIAKIVEEGHELIDRRPVRRSDDERVANL